MPIKPIKPPKRIQKLMEQEKQTIALRVTFASVSGKESDDDAARFLAEIQKIFAKFNPKSTMNYTVNQKTVTRRG